MQAYRVETKIEKDGSITLQHSPFQAGESIEVIVLVSAVERETIDTESLRGAPAQFKDPFEPVALEDWEAIN